MSPSNNQQGFTLIEVLLTMSLLGIFFTLLGGVMVQQIKTTERVSEQAFLQQDVRHALSVMSTAIRTATAVDEDLSDNPLPGGIGTQNVAVITQTGVTKYFVLDASNPDKPKLMLYNDNDGTTPDNWVNITSEETKVTSCSSALQSNGLWQISISAKRVLKNGQEHNLTLTSQVGQRLKGF